MNAIARDLAARLEAAKYAVNDEVNDLRLEVGKWSLENAASLVFDKRLGCLQNEGEGKELGRIMVEANAKIFKVIDKLCTLLTLVYVYSKKLEDMYSTKRLYELYSRVC